MFCLPLIDAIPTEVQIRVCPSIQDRRGWLWTKNVFDKDHWMMDVEFSITGKHTYGADGMVRNKYYCYGPVVLCAIMYIIMVQLHTRFVHEV